MREDKTVIVADFGLARIISHATSSVRRSPKGELTVFDLFFNVYFDFLIF